MFHKKINVQPYDSKIERPVIHASICNGEQMAGFHNLISNEFREVMLITEQSDLDLFCSQYGVTKTDIKKEY